MPSERSSKVSETIDQAVQSLFQTLSSSYGPKGMDKMLIKGKNTTITNDGATIMSFYKTHPIHKVLSNVSSTQDSNCGDGTTSVVLLIGCIMDKIKRLRSSGIHPSKIVEALETAKKIAVKYIDEVKIKIEEDEFINVALTTLNSKIASKSNKMAQVAIEALKKSKKEELKIVKKVGGNIDDIELVDGLLLNRPIFTAPGETNKVLVLQFCISAPKTNLDSKIVINDYLLMERFVREEREYVINIIKKIKKTGANLLIIQKSIVRESCSELALHFLKKVGISVVDGVERKDVEFICSQLKISPITDVDLLSSDLVDSEVELNTVTKSETNVKSSNVKSESSVKNSNVKSESSVKSESNVKSDTTAKNESSVKSDITVKSDTTNNTANNTTVNQISINTTIKNMATVNVEQIRGMVCLKNIGCSILVSGCDDLVVDEAERSLNDVLCVIRALLEEPYIVPGGGSVETGIACQLDSQNSLVLKEIAQGFLGMPHVLAHNSGLYSTEVLSNLKKNIGVNKNLGISLRTGLVSDMVNDDQVIQPAGVSKSVFVLAIETVQMLVRIDDILPSQH